MKILVTGGAGFIGSHVVDAYITAGHEVVVVDNLSGSTKDFINPNARFYYCDITSPQLKEIFEKERPDIVNHHAAQMNVRVSIADPLQDAHVNILGLLNVLRCSVEVDVKKFIFISSGGAVYGENSCIPIMENASSQPLSPYGLAKYTGEQYVALFHKLHGLCYTVLRYGNVYGPRQNSYGEAGVIAIFISRMLHNEQLTIFGDGAQTRDYVYIADIVAANLLCLEKGHYNVFNLGTGKETSVKALFGILQEQLHYTKKPSFANLSAGEIFRNALDCTFAGEMLDWKAKYDLVLGIKETVLWFRKQNGASQ